MKVRIIIVLAIVKVLLLSAFAVKRYIDNSITDKYGMVRETEDDKSESADIFIKRS